jgi:archaellum component FlaG (FlaF/FlaG flagellin family)
MFYGFMNYILVHITLLNDKHNKTNLNTNYMYTFVSQNANKYILENSEKMNFIIDGNMLTYKPKYFSLT